MTKTDEAPKRGRRGQGTVYAVRDTTGRVTGYRAAKSRTHTLEDGTKKRVRVIADGHTEAQALRNLDLKLTGNSEVFTPKDLTFKKWFELWTENIEGDVSYNTLRGYTNIGVKYLIPKFGNKHLNRITREELKKFFKTTLPNIKDDDGNQVLSLHAQRNIYKVFRNCLNSAVADRRTLLNANPIIGVKSPTVPKQRMKLGAQVGAAQGFVKWMKETNHPDEARLLFNFLGLRRGERLGLTWSNIRNLSNAKTARIVVSQQLLYEARKGYRLAQPKTEASVREIPLTEPFLSSLRAWKRKQEEYKASADWNPKPEFADLVFLQANGSIITHNKDNDDWNTEIAKYLYNPKDANGNDRKVRKDVEAWRGHLNRYITATLLADAKVAPAVAMKIIGHSDETMLHYYTRIDTQQAREPMKDFAQVLTSRVKKG